MHSACRSLSLSLTLPFTLSSLSVNASHERNARQTRKIVNTNLATSANLYKFYAHIKSLINLFVHQGPPQHVPRQKIKYHTYQSVLNNFAMCTSHTFEFRFCVYLCAWWRSSVFFNASMQMDYHIAVSVTYTIFYLFISCSRQCKRRDKMQNTLM